MTADELYAAGNRLFDSPHWQSSLAQLLGVRVRTMRRWVSGQNEVPDWVATALELHLELRERLEADKTRDWRDFDKSSGGHGK